MPIDPGQQLVHYCIERRIGQGGMRAVFVAEDTKLDRKVALKVLPEGMAADDDRLERFRREAKAVAALTHPHIVTLHSVEEDEGTQFLTMELVEGSTLDRTLPPRWAAAGAGVRQQELGGDDLVDPEGRAAAPGAARPARRFNGSTKRRPLATPTWRRSGRTPC